MEMMQQSLFLSHSFQLQQLVPWTNELGHLLTSRHNCDKKVPQELAIDLQDSLKVLTKTACQGSFKRPQYLGWSESAY